IVPGTSADHPLSAVGPCSGAAIARIACVAIVPAVLGPLPDVAVDVIETPRVRLEAVHRHRALPILALGASSPAAAGRRQGVAGGFACGGTSASHAASRSAAPLRLPEQSESNPSASEVHTFKLSRLCNGELGCR